MAAKKGGGRMGWGKTKTGRTGTNGRRYKGATASKAQWKWAFATGQPFARAWAHNAGKGKYKSLPARTGGGGGGGGRKKGK